MLKYNKPGFGWKKAKQEFCKKRTIHLPIEQIKEVEFIDDFELSSKEKLLVDNMIQDCCKNIYYSTLMVLEKFEYVERTGYLKFDDKKAKEYVFPVLKAKPTFDVKWQLCGSDVGATIGSTTMGYFERFPVFKEERLFFEGGLINNFMMDSAELLNGVVLAREDVFEAIRLIFYKEKVKLMFKIQRQILIKRCKEV